MPLAEHKELVDYLPNGKAVCFDHHLRVCPYCCVDFAYGESSDEESSGDDEDGEVSGDDEDEDMQDKEHFKEDRNDDRVFVLGGSRARFIPQWDGQILGPANTLKISMNFDSPPKPDPPSVLTLCPCSTCDLTWLKGNNGLASAQSHPSHHTYEHEYAGTGRSLLVFVDGACSSNGSSDARAGIGIYFGENSRYNLGEAMSQPGPATSQKAELFALARALEKVRLQVASRHREMCKAEKGASQAAIRDASRFRLVVATDSSYLVESMCKHIEGWTMNEASGQYKNRKGNIIKNSDLIKQIVDEVEELSLVGIQVVYYQVGREHNVHADKLAKMCVKPVNSSMTSYPDSAE